jgi:hypothetical protein
LVVVLQDKQRLRRLLLEGWAMVLVVVLLLPVVVVLLLPVVVVLLLPVVVVLLLPVVVVVVVVVVVHPLRSTGGYL